MNLVGNAILYTPSGGHVRVTLWQSGAQVVLAVTDTGRGVGAADVERMFKPFVRLGDGGALGVGLAIARHIVQAHGGSIHAASAAGPRHHGDSRYSGLGNAEEHPRPPAAMVPYWGAPGWPPWPRALEKSDGGTVTSHRSSSFAKRRRVRMRSRASAARA